MGMLFDTHSHIIDKRFDKDRDELLAGLKDRGVGNIVTVACERDEVEGCIKYAEKYDFIYAAFGVHPHNAGEMTDQDLDLIKKTCEHEKVVGVGEIGLDYHYDFSPRETQKIRFIQQLELASELNMPAILHIREAFGDAIDILRSCKKPGKGVLHCFSGSYEFAKECLDMGFYVSFAGTITFDNNKRGRDIAARIPKDMTVIETDCPYLAPHPMRGKRNDPGYVMYTAKTLAEIWDMDLDETINKTTQNAKELFGLK